MIKIYLEDNGQDFTEIICDDDGVIIETIPFQTEIWKGGAVSTVMIEVGKELPLHHPPHINFGFLKHKVEKIEQINKSK